MQQLTIHPNPNVEFGNLMNIIRLIKSELNTYLHHEAYNNRYVLHGLSGNLTQLENEISTFYFCDNAPQHNRHYFDLANRSRLISKFRRLMNQFLNIKLYDAMSTEAFETETKQARLPEAVSIEAYEMAIA